MSSIQDRAAALHQSGMNCAQSVLMALEEYTHLDSQTAQKIAAGFGGGVRCGEICGSISGGVMALGLAGNAAGGQKLTRAFYAQHGCLRCQELVRKYGGKGHCEAMICDAAKLTEQILKGEI